MAKVKVKVKLNVPRPDLTKTRDKLHKEMTKFTIDQMKTWVLNTTDPIPVYTGAARASFLFLAAKAFTSISINPVAPSRITLGITEATSEIFSIPGKKYGWSWESDLAHIGIVEDRVGFVNAGLASIKRAKPKLPQPIFKPLKKTIS